MLNNALQAVIWLGEAGAAVLIIVFVYKVWHSSRLKEIAAKADAETLDYDSLGNPQVKVLPNGAMIIPPPGQRPRSNVAKVPQHIVFSPTYHHDVRGVESHQEATRLPEPVITVSSVPTFSTLLEQGEFNNKKQLLLGYSEGKPLHGTWNDLYSCIIAGLSGSGKTTTARFIALQAAIKGASFLLIDPHGGSGEESLLQTLAPLESSFLCKPAIQPRDIEAVLNRANQELQNRLSDMTNRHSRPPVIICVDEVTSLMRKSQADDISAMLQNISQEGRKVGVFALVMGQIWKSTTSGGTETRDSFASAIVHKMQRKQAQLLVPIEIARQVEVLDPKKGQAFFSSTRGDIIPVQIPNTTLGDAINVARLLTPAKKPVRTFNIPAGMLQPFTVRTGQETESGVTQATVEAAKTGWEIPLTTDEQRALAAWKAGNTTTRAVQDACGMTYYAAQKACGRLRELRLIVDRSPINQGNAGAAI
jgi:hypothetical protein